MPNFSSITAVGHLGRDAEVRQAGASPVVSWSMAVTRKRKDVETTTWFRCSWFGERAAKVAQYLTKGKAILVQGELYERSYEQDGEVKKALEIDVRDVALLGSGKADGEVDPAKAETEPIAKPLKRLPTASVAADDDEPPF